MPERRAGHVAVASDKHAGWVALPRRIILEERAGAANLTVALLTALANTGGMARFDRVDAARVINGSARELPLRNGGAAPGPAHSRGYLRAFLSARRALSAPCPGV